MKRLTNCRSNTNSLSDIAEIWQSLYNMEHQHSETLPLDESIAEDLDILRLFAANLVWPHRLRQNAF